MSPRRSGEGGPERSVFFTVQIGNVGDMPLGLEIRKPEELTYSGGCEAP